MHRIRALFTSRRASVSVLAAVILPVVAATSGLAAEYGFGLLASVQNQRVADLAAYGGALAYNSSASTTTMISAIDRVATLNGLATSNISATVVNSPTGDGSQAVRVVVSTTVPRPLSGLLGGATTLPVSAFSYAELKPAGAACIVALSSSGSGVTLSGGTSVSAPACTVASNASVTGSNYAVTVPCGTTITTIVVDYATGASPNALCSGITAPSGKSLTLARKTTNDPLSTNAGVISALGHMSSVAAITSPGAPSVTATASSSNNVALSYYPTTPVTFPGGTATYSGNTWTVTCTSSCSFGSLTVSGGQNLAFSGPSSATFNFKNAVSTAATTTYGSGNYNFGAGITTSGTTTFGAGTYNITGNISTSGTTTFGAGTYNISGSIINGGGATTTFGAGTFNIGSSASSCNSDNYSICNGGSLLTFTGPTTLVLSSGIYNGGGSTLAIGSGSTANSYRVGSTSGGRAYYGGGGSVTTFGDASGSGLFQVKGLLDVSSGGGSCLALPAAAQHDINGGFTTAGGTTLGGGVYTFNGYMAMGNSGGGSVSCNGTSTSLNGTGVTLVVSGTTTPSSGNCAGLAFCVASGFNNITVTAPSAGTTASLVLIGPAASSGITAGATFSQGASGATLAGAMYFPNGPISLGGGSSLGSGATQCLEIIGSQIALTGGSTAASTCTGLGSGATSSTVVLVQ